MEDARANGAIGNQGRLTHLQSTGKLWLGLLVCAIVVAMVFVVLVQENSPDTN
jgi:hypothetical protein